MAQGALVSTTGKCRGSGHDLQHLLGLDARPLLGELSADVTFAPDDDGYPHCGGCFSTKPGGAACVSAYLTLLSACLQLLLIRQE
jgi:hypothetical protein